MRRITLFALPALFACATSGNGNGHGDLISGVDADVTAEIRPQDDFYLHVNKKWLDQTKIPSDRSNYGSFTVLVDESEKNLKAIVDDIAAGKVSDSPDAKKISDYFTAYMDTKTIESRGLEPVKALLAEIDAIADKKGLAMMFGKLERVGVRNPLGFYVNQDAKNSTQYIGYLTQNGLGLPDRDYYFKEGEKMDAARAAFDTYLDTLLTQAIGADAASTRPQVSALEKRLAEVSWTRTESRDRDKTYNKKTFAELSTLAPAIDWAAWAEGTKLPKPEAVIVRQPSFFEGVSKAVEEVPLDDWKMYLKAAVIDDYATLLPKAFVDAHFAFHGKALSGVEEIRPREKRALEIMDAHIGEALGKIYVERHFKPEAKARMKELVANLIRAFDGGIESLEWMSPETKKKAKEKLSKFTTKIGYPDVWRDYGKLEVKADDAFGNAMRAQAFEHDRRIAYLGGPIDKNEWFMRPHTVNAYYNPVMNEIVFPAAILQPPFFNLAADDAVNYGAIGAVIGHELSHGFDDQGRKSNGDGNLVDWWTEQDAEEFKKRSQLMVEQYNQYEALPGKTVNGELTLGENIGDLGGLTIAYRAYQLSLEGGEAPVIDGYTGNQRFFLGWGQIWRRKYRDAELERRLVVDPHSPSRFRVIGILSNMPEFYEAFEVKEGDELYRAPDQRVKIW
ncbi:MAG: M13-type metalloendopeptidase [Deltaproteobacteria bacterium]|jgi:putative endopeptidase